MIDWRRAARLVFLMSLSQLVTVEVVSAEGMSIPWTNGASVTFSPGEHYHYSDAQIVHQGELKFVRFSLAPKDTNEPCRLSGTEDQPTDVVFTVNQQTIQGRWICLRYTDTRSRFYLIYAVTATGNDFIVNALKESDEIRIEHDLLDFTISGEGFTAEWERSG